MSGDITAEIKRLSRIVCSVFQVVAIHQKM
jgi:hypothetical protein